MPNRKLPSRNAHGHGHGHDHDHHGVTYYKPHGIARWLPTTDYLVWMDMDLLVTNRTAPDFARTFIVPEVDLTLTDHNIMLNNGAVVFKNT